MRTRWKFKWWRKRIKVFTSPTSGHSWDRHTETVSVFSALYYNVGSSISNSIVNLRTFADDFGNIVEKQCLLLGKKFLRWNGPEMLTRRILQRWFRVKISRCLMVLRHCLIKLPATKYLNSKFQPKLRFLNKFQSLKNFKLNFNDWNPKLRRNSVKLEDWWPDGI